MALIFFTGAVVLALEVLASRIMTPYFGVSLYIWAGILSITLAFLAIGYFLGGYFCKRYDRARIGWLFFALPVAAAFSVLGASAVYPVWFPALADMHLIAGSFIASAALLALPLVCLSAMNPMLIALLAPSRNEAAGGDGGAGKVFFVSTAGSVAGVAVTAFGIIPSLTNFQALLWLALGLAIAALGFAAAAPVPAGRPKRALLGGALAAALIAGLFLAVHDRYMAWLSADAGGAYEFQVLAEYSSVFGNLKVIDISTRESTDLPVKAFVQDGQLQNRTTRDNVSVSMYTYVLDRLAGMFAPKAGAALVLGLGAGIVPADMKRRGLDVTVVEINPDALRAATEHFGFRPADFTLRIEDARTYVRRCRAAFAVVVVDLFQGDGIPDYLLTAEFFRSIRRCLGDGGVVVMNASFDDMNDHPNRRLLATVAAAFDRVVQFDLPEANAFIVGATGPLPASLHFSSAGIPAPLVDVVARTFKTAAVVTPRTIAGAAPLTDRQNLASILFADMQMRKRRAIVRLFPPRVLVN